MASAINLMNNQYTSELINNHNRKNESKFSELSSPFINTTTTIEYPKSFKCDHPKLHQQTIYNFNPSSEHQYINNSTLNISFNSGTSTDVKISPNYQVIYNEEGEFEISIDKYGKNDSKRNNFKNRLLNILKIKKRRANYYSPPLNVIKEPMTVFSNVSTSKLNNDKQTTFMTNTSLSSIENVISNSSLKSFEGQELADELKLYMEELKMREMR